SMERKLQQMKGETDATKNDARPLKIHAEKTSTKLQKSAKTCSLLTKEKHKLLVDLREEQCKTLVLESKLRGMELQRICD
ncbi:hypothetical protein U1Q18_017064, partial [Sarracenia purpurea var. burkii]